MNKIKISDRIIKTSILIFIVSVVLNPIIYSFAGWGTVFIMRIISIVLLIIHKITIKDYTINAKYAVLLMIILLPFFYNNAYIHDGHYKPILDYVLTIPFAILASTLQINKKHVLDYVLKCYFIFAAVTSFFTIMSLVLPDLYLNIAKTLFAPEYYTMMSDGVKMQSLFGLTSHYSSNAFYVAFGVIYLLFFKNQIDKRIRIAFLGIFFICLLLIGKRGHLLFLVISLGLGYAIIKRISIMTIVKSLAVITAILLTTIVIINVVPQANRTFNRMLAENAENGDLTSGRFNMYEDINELYKENGSMPIGWAQYAHSTNYYHPALHNDYLQLYYEVGVIGSVLVLAPNIYFIVLSYRRLRTDNSPQSKLVFIFNIFFNLYALTGTPRYDIEVYAPYFILNGYLFANNKQVKETV